MRPQLNPLILGPGAPWSLPGSSLDLQFTTGRAAVNRQTSSISSLLTTTRASTGYASTLTGSLTLFPTNTPRITDLGLLVEQAATNLIIQSQTLDNAAWTPNHSTITANVDTAPDGTLTADKIVTANADTNFHQVNATTFTATGGSAYTVTAYLKASGWRYGFINVFYGGASHNYAVSFDLQTGAKSGFYTGNTATPTFAITQATNGFWRVSVTSTDASGGTTTVSIGALNAAGDFSAGGTGDGVSGVIAWGAQAELGAAATSYIPTTTVAVTRAIDNEAAAAALLTALQSASGTVIMSVGGGIAAAVGTLLGINALIGLGKTAADKLTTAFGGAQTSGNTATWTGNNKIGLRWSANAVAICLNGGTIVTAANTPPAVTSANIGSTSGSSAAVNQFIKRLTVIPSSVSDATFQALTT